MEKKIPFSSLPGSIGARPAAGHAQPEAERVERERRRKSGRARGKQIKATKVDIGQQ